MSIFQQTVTTSLPANPGPQSRPLRWLFISALIFELFYLFLLICSAVPGMPLSGTPLVVTWSQILSPAQFPLSLLQTLVEQYPWVPNLVLGLIFAGLISTYIVVITITVRTVDHHSVTRRWLFVLLGCTFIFGLTLLILPRIFSDDIFNSMFSGRILAIYDQNPLTNKPIQFKGYQDPYLTWVVSGQSKLNIYGPLWVYVASFLALLSHNPVVTFFLFKGFSFLTHLLNCVLIWTLLGKIAPTRRLAGTLLYAWSPLALIELAGSGHNEGLLISLLLLATLVYVLKIERAQRQSQRDAEQPGLMGFLRSANFLGLCTLLLFSLAVCVNLIALLIVLLFLWYELRSEANGMRIFIGFSWRLLIVLLPLFLLMKPLWDGSDTFVALTSTVNMDQFVHSPISILALPLGYIFQTAAGKNLPSFLNPAATASLAVRGSATFVFVVIYAQLFGKVRQPLYPRPEQSLLLAELDVLLSCSTIAVFWFMVLVSGWFWPWYILWILWLVPLRRFDVFASAILVLSGTALFIYTFVGFSTGPLEAYQAAAIFGIPLVYLLIVRNRQTQAERTINADVRRGQTTKN